MKIFEKHPLYRLIFTVVYILTAIRFYVDKGWSSFTFLCQLIMILCAYVGLVKSGIIRNKQVAAVDNFNFDFLSIVWAIALLIVKF
jgi:hypothetical protein